MDGIWTRVQLSFLVRCEIMKGASERATDCIAEVTVWDKSFTGRLTYVVHRDAYWTVDRAGSIFDDEPGPVVRVVLHRHGPFPVGLDDKAKAMGALATAVWSNAADLR